MILKHAVAMGLDVDMQVTDKARVLLGKSRRRTEHIAAVPWAEVPDFYPSMVGARLRASDNGGGRSA